MFLSVIIPAYNEESRIVATLEQIVGFMSSQAYTWEVLVVDDGSTDTTGSLVAELAISQPNLRLITLLHRGKGWAVKNGMLEAVGQYRLLCDADLSVSIDQVERFLPPQTGEIDIAVGSRETTGSYRIGEPLRRHIMGRVYNTLVRLLAVPGLADTQCGFKCFQGRIVPELFQSQTMDGFAFDVEILFLATKAGMTLQEVPVEWHFRELSKVSALRDSWLMTLDLMKILWRHSRRGS